MTQKHRKVMFKMCGAKEAAWDRAGIVGVAADCAAISGADPPPHSYNGGQNGSRHRFDFANEFSPGC